MKALRILRFCTGLLLLLALAALFIWSGWTKLRTLEPFTWSFLDILPISLTGASILAHLAIGLEWTIGAWLAAQLYLRRFTYKATIALLLLLTIYLAVLIIRQGNNGNCGCFGEWLYMRPAAGIWKNVVLLAIVALLYFLYPSRPYRGQNWVALVLVIAAFTVPFVLRPVVLYGSGEVVHEGINLDPVYALAKPAPSEELRKGKHIICFFSTTCPHCRKGAYLVQILHRQYPELPLFMVLSGGAGMEEDFLLETKSTAVPHTLLMNMNAFSALAGRYVPAIFWVNNSVIERKTYFTELEPAAIKAWLRK